MPNDLDEHDLAMVLQGVKSRSGWADELLLKPEWISDFSRRLAEADTAYFVASAKVAAKLPLRD